MGTPTPHAPKGRAPEQPRWGEVVRGRETERGERDRGRKTKRMKGKKRSAGREGRWVEVGGGDERQRKRKQWRRREPERDSYEDRKKSAQTQRKPEGTERPGNRGECVVEGPGY